MQTIMERLANHEAAIESAAKLDDLGLAVAEIKEQIEAIKDAQSTDAITGQSAQASIEMLTGTIESLKKSIDAASLAISANKTAFDKAIAAVSANVSTNAANIASLTTSLAALRKSITDAKGKL